MNNEGATVQSVYASLFEPALLNEIEKKSTVLTAAAGQEMIKMGQTIRVVPLMLSGTLKVMRTNDEGQDLLLYYVKAGKGCAMTLSCGMMAQPSLVKASAEDDLSMLIVPIATMEDWMLRYPSWKRFVMSTIVSEFVDVINSVDEVTFKKMDDRLINYLKGKSLVAGSTLLNVTHQQIADELGTNRVVVSRLLKKLETEGKLLLYRNQIKLMKEL